MKLRPILVLLLAATCDAQELDGDLRAALQSLNHFQITREERLQRANAGLFACPQWETRLGEVLARLAVQARMAEGTQNENFTSVHTARMELGGLLGMLGRTADPRVVPLLAPLLVENSAMLDEGDAIYPPPAFAAASALAAITAYGTDLPGAPSLDLPEMWLPWWQKHRAEYPAPPTPLAALEASVATVPGAPADGPARPDLREPAPAVEPKPAPPSQAIPKRGAFSPRWLGLSAALLVVLFFSKRLLRRR